MPPATAPWLESMMIVGASGGVRRITVCDMHGVVQPSTAALRGALGGAAVVVAGGPFSPVDAGAQVRVVPAQAGREELVATARRTRSGNVGSHWRRRA